MGLSLRHAVLSAIAGAFGNPFTALKPQRGVARTDKFRRHKPGRLSWLYRSKYLPHQSTRECARRRRQIAAGILTESNGLVRSAV